MQARILARRQVKTGLCLALLHHPIGTDVEVAGIGIARDHCVAGAGIASAVERPVPRDRQLIEIDIVTDRAVLVDWRLLGWDLTRRDASLELVLSAMDKLHFRCVDRLFQSQRHAAEAWAKDVPEHSSANRAIVESARSLEQNCR